ncbi:MAG: hypothetical protein ABJB01_01860 [Rudaea sp.]
MPSMRTHHAIRILSAACAIGSITGARAQSIDAYNPLPNGSPKGLAIQTDGKVIIGGQFQSVGATSVSGIARLDADGSVDSTFTTPAVNSEIKAVAIQKDGKILIGGAFDAIGTTPRHYLARLNVDGSLDMGFADPHLDNTVWSIVVQPDGNVLVAGGFTVSGTTSRNRVARFTSAGILDSSFADPQICNSEARNVALQSNGEVVVEGFFAYVGNCSSPTPHEQFYLARFSTAGVLDSSFPVDPPNSPLSALVIGPDDAIYVNGGFSVTAGGLRLVSKLSANGTFIPSYANLANDGATNSFALQPDGKLVLGGDFQTIATQSRHGLARLNADGTLDTGFADLHVSLTGANPNGSVFALAAQTDGKVIATGNFSLVNGQSRQFAARIILADPAVSQLTAQASGSNVIVTWVRSGAGPELAQPPILMHSVDAVTYTAIGTMTRISNGWRMTAPYNVNGAPFFLQAVGFTSSGAANGSSGSIESPVYSNDRIFANGFE